MDTNNKDNNHEIVDVMEVIEDKKEFCFYDYLFVVSIGQVYVFSFFLRQIIAPIADVLEEDFHATSSQIGLCSSLLFVGYFTMQIPSGVILQIYECEFVSLICAAFMGINCILFSFAPSIQFATAIQCITGIASAPIAISTLSIIKKRFGNQFVSFVFGAMKFYTFFSTLALQTLQAYIYETYKIWKPAFWFVGGCCLLLSLIMLIAMIFESNYNKNNEDYGEISMQQLNNRLLSNTSSKQNIPLISNTNRTNNTCSICWNGIKKKHGDESVLHSILKSLKYSVKNWLNWIGGIFYFSITFIIYGFIGLWLISYLMLKFNYSRSIATLISSSFYIASAVSSLIMGHLSTKYQRRKIFLIFSLILMAALLVIIYCNKNTPIYVIVISNLVSGIGFGASNPIFWASVIEYNTYYNCSEIAVGLVNSISNSSGFVSQYLMGLLFDIHWSHIRGGNDIDDENGDRIYNLHDYNFGFITITISFVIAMISLSCLKETYAKPLQYCSKS